MQEYANGRLRRPLRFLAPSKLHTEVSLTPNFLAVLLRAVIRGPRPLMYSLRECCPPLSLLEVKPSTD